MATWQRTDPITDIPGVGQFYASRLRRLGIVTIEQLLWHAPSGYQDFRKQVPVTAAPVGEPVSLVGSFRTIDHRRSWTSRRLQVTSGVFEDESGHIAVVWFGKFPRKNIPIRVPVYVWGELEERDGKRQMTNPQWRLQEGHQPPGLQAVYPLTAGVTSWHLRQFISLALDGCAIEDWQSPPFRQQHQMIPLSEAFRLLHQPVDESSVALARRRLAFDELLLQHVLRGVLQQERRAQKAPVIVFQAADELAAFKVAPTRDQVRAVEDVAADLAQPHPMSRLLQGEVGSGKTLVALAVARGVAAAGYTTLFLAPTEVLADQHLTSLTALIPTAPMRAAIYTRTQAHLLDRPDLSRKDVRAAIANGEVDVVIGTHALLEDAFVLPRLGLVLIDEQHRFGVRHRLEALQKAQGYVPHVLSMTATPIPRTLELALLGDVAISTLRELPFGPRNIRTMLFQAQDRRRVEEAIRRRLMQGEQAYVVCPLIDPSDSLGMKSVTEEYARLQKEPAFQTASIGLLHGRMTGDERVSVLDAFRSGALNVLIATTVVEVGVDAPRATMMIIEGAERFGLAQLYQLRGRVGRRGTEGVCVLFPQSASPEAMRRLEAFASTNDGFALAEMDLHLRGPGEWFGSRQSGYLDFAVADFGDVALQTEAQDAATTLLAEDGVLKHHPVLARRVEEALLRVAAA